MGNIRYTAYTFQRNFFKFILFCEKIDFKILKKALKMFIEFYIQFFREEIFYIRFYGVFD